MDQMLREQWDEGEVISEPYTAVPLEWEAWCCYTSRPTTENDDALCFKKLERFRGHLPCEIPVFLIILTSISVFNCMYQRTPWYLQSQKQQQVKTVSSNRLLNGLSDLHAYFPIKHQFQLFNIHSLTKHYPKAFWKCRELSVLLN